MELTDLEPDEIYENTNGEVAQLKAMDGTGNVYVKILKEKEGKYERETRGRHRGTVAFHTSSFLVFWRQMKRAPTTA